MMGSRVAKFVAVGATLLLLGFVVVVSGSSHETDDVDDPEEVVSAEGPGPRPGQPVAMPRDLVAVEIALGVDRAPARRWEGEVVPSEGRLVDLEIVRGGVVSKSEGGRFSANSVPAKKAAAAKKKKAAAKKKKAQQAKKKAAAGGPILRATFDAPAKSKVTVRTNHGEFAFTLADLVAGRQVPFLEGEATVERQTAAVRLTGVGSEDDFPVSAQAGDGTIWLVDVEYHPEVARLVGEIAPKDFDDRLVPKKHGDRIRLRRFDGKTWQPALDVTEGGLDVWRPTVAVDGKGVVWIAWAQQVDGDWEIFRRSYTPPGAGGGEGTWSDVVRVTRGAGSDFHVVAATDTKGTVWLAWQGWREGNYDIWVAAQEEGHPWSEPRAISQSLANDWSPAIVADSRGNVLVAWDTYDRGNYDVRLRVVGKDAPIRTVAGSARFEGRPHLAADKEGRVWIGYEEGDEQWGKDFAHAGSVRNVGLEKNPGYALYVNRTVRVKCLADDQLWEPAGTLEAAFAGKIDRNKSVPRLAVAADGGVWLLVRHHPGPGNPGEVWVSSALRYDGKAWSSPQRLANSSNLMDNRPALSAIGGGGGLIAVYSTDTRNNTQSRKQDDLYSAFLMPETSASKTPELVPESTTPESTVATVHPNEAADVARARGYRVDAGGKSLRLLRGEFHRHTEFSSHNDQDGLLEDAWRYALDAGRLDWMGDGDHDNGFGHEYMWWIIQKMTDLHHNAPHFVAAQTYERSVVFPNGHRNVMMPRRGIRPLPRGELPGTAEAGTPDTKLLYAYLKHFGGICASHTSATGMGTDWRDNDPEVEPVVEIFQGHRHNYEYQGAPRSPSVETQIGGYQPSGFIWNALKKGYRLGFQSSSDHVSTHLSYAIVLAEEVSRQGIIDAFKKRHCYAATDNIILVVRSGEHLMGDTFTTSAKPKLEIQIHGTAPVAKVHVIRDNAYAFSTEPNRAEVALSYSDDDAKPGESHYYYVRVEQADGNLAWGSPLWITCEK